MKKALVIFLSSFTSFGLMAQNLELMRGDSNMKYYIDKDSIEKKGQYYQANLVIKLKKPEKVKIPSGQIVQYDHQVLLFKYDCKNNSDYLAKFTNYMNGQLVSSDFNPSPEKFTPDTGGKDGITNFVCENYFLK